MDLHLLFIGFREIVWFALLYLLQELGIDLVVLYSLYINHAVGFKDEEAARTRAVGEEFTVVARTRERSLV